MAKRKSNKHVIYQEINMDQLGKRAKIVNDQDPRFINITGRLQRCEDGYEFVIDHPLPQCCQGYEDSRSGTLTLGESLEDVAIIAEDAPVHEGQQDGENPLTQILLDDVKKSLKHFGIDEIVFE